MQLWNAGMEFSGWFLQSPRCATMVTYFGLWKRLSRNLSDLSSAKMHEEKIVRKANRTSFFMILKCLLNNN
jgi:hypothetical protein